jgi:hypothetical protein
MATRTTIRHRDESRLSAQAQVQARANGYCLLTYGDAYVGGKPHRLLLPSGRIWIVPVMFANASFGPVGQVGVVALDSKTLEVLDATPRSEVRAEGVRLAREKRDVLDSAFSRARTD